MNNTVKIPSMLAIIVLGAVAMLWILGVAEIEELTGPAARTIGAIVVGAAVIIGVVAVAGSRGSRQ